MLPAQMVQMMENSYNNDSAPEIKFPTRYSTYAHTAYTASTRTSMISMARSDASYISEIPDIKLSINGKSTLLDVLAGRKDPKMVSGQILLNGAPGDIKFVSQYVMQDDALMGVLTVKENIQFAADLWAIRVQQIIEEFGLSRVANSKIGTVFIRGVSGGEKRRASIASQVITLPKIIFLDEPTSGLDSAAAYHVMKSIGEMARKHKLTVIASIHQPSTETYSLFDKLCLIGRGHTLYFGNRENATSYFEGLGHVCPPYANPADHYLRLINSDFMVDKTEAEKHIDNFIVSYEQSKAHSTTLAEIRNITKPNMYLKSRSTSRYALGYKQENIQDRFAAHFFSVAFLAFMSVAGIPGFLEERLVFQRERGNNFYSVGPYVLANTIIAIPFVMIIAASFTVVAYPMIGLNGDLDHAIRFGFFLFLALIVAESMVLKWAHYIDYQKWAFEAIIKNDFVGLTFDCDKIADKPPHEYDCKYGDLTGNNSTFTGQDVLDSY
ncbi:3958_t:CDS:2, partial [Racocetra fulgida]